MKGSAEVGGDHSRPDHHLHRGRNQAATAADTTMTRAWTKTRLTVTRIPPSPSGGCQHHNGDRIQPPLLVRVSVGEKTLTKGHRSHAHSLRQLLSATVALEADEIGPPQGTTKKMIHGQDS